MADTSNKKDMIQALVSSEPMPIIPESQFNPLQVRYFSNLHTWVRRMAQRISTGNIITSTGLSVSNTGGCCGEFADTVAGMAEDGFTGGKINSTAPCEQANLDMCADSIFCTLTNLNLSRYAAATGDTGYVLEGVAMEFERVPYEYGVSQGNAWEYYGSFNSGVITVVGNLYCTTINNNCYWQLIIQVSVSGNLNYTVVFINPYTTRCPSPTMQRRLEITEDPTTEEYVGSYPTITLSA